MTPLLYETLRDRDTLQHRMDYENDYSVMRLRTSAENYSVMRLRSVILSTLTQDLHPSNRIGPNVSY